ncbi:MAG: hypothetical protein GY757_55740 [bacterium]|nr:hypothetical protein [bacterium]
MGNKKKKKIMKQVRRNKSNKMIYAVAGGLLILISIFLAVTISQDTKIDKKELMTDTLDYLNTTEGILATKLLHEETKAIIIYDPLTKDQDFKLIARYAGMKLSNKIGEEELTVILCEKSEDNPVYSYKLKNGEVLEEK